MVGVTSIDAPGPVTVAEFEALPDDGNRYELLDGALHMTPAPAWLHQVGTTRLSRVLAEAAPRGLEVVVNPGYRANPRSILVPDLAVARHPGPGEKYLGEPPSLVVEVLSPSSRTHDRVRKLAAYELAGVAAYWILDVDEPSLLVFERVGARLVERAHVTGDETFAAAVPFEVVVVPAELVAR